MWWRRPRRQLGEAAQILGEGCEGELELSSAGPAQPKPAEPEDALEVGEQHLDAFAVAAGFFESLGLAQRTRYVAGILIDAARDLARRLLWAASHLERAHVAVELAGPVQQCINIHDLAGCREHLASRARVEVARFVERE